MKFESKAQKKVLDKVGDCLKKSFGKQFNLLKDVAGYTGLQGSAIVAIRILPWGSDEAVVNVSSCCVMDVELTPELMEFLLRKNYEFRFGAFSIDKDGDIVFEHTVVGSTMDRKELESSVRAVAETADAYDDLIVSRYGGVTGLQKLRISALETS